jgi:hypothetical protein
MILSLLESPFFWLALVAAIISLIVICCVRASRKAARWLRENHHVGDPGEVGKTREFTNGTFRFLVKLTEPIRGSREFGQVTLECTGEVTLLYPSDWTEHPRIEADGSGYRFAASLKDGRMVLGCFNLWVGDKDRNSIRIVPAYGTFITMRRAEPENDKAMPAKA